MSTAHHREYTENNPEPVFVEGLFDLGEVGSYAWMELIAAHILQDLSHAEYTVVHTDSDGVSYGVGFDGGSYILGRNHSPIDEPHGSADPEDYYNSFPMGLDATKCGPDMVAAAAVSNITVRKILKEGRL